MHSIFLRTSLTGNYLRDRFKNKRRNHRPSSINGFKYQVKGRLSRRQRSVRLWRCFGRMPLTRLDEWIDTDYSIITLENSAVSIRVWMHYGDLSETFLMSANIYNNIVRKGYFLN